MTLSLVADDCLQNREDADRERTLPTGIRQDLPADSSSIRTVAQVGTRNSNAAAWLLHRFEHGPPVPPGSMGQRFVRVLATGTYRPVMPTYVALQEGGQLGLMDDPTARRAITDHHEDDVQGIIQQSDYWIDQLVHVRETFRPYRDAPRQDTLPANLTAFRLLSTWSEEGVATSAPPLALGSAS